MIRQKEEVFLSKILKPEYIFFLKGRQKKEEVVKFLSDKISNLVIDKVTPKELFDRVMEVEKLNNVLETGFYIPHAKLQEIRNFFAALALLPDGFNDPAKPSITVRAVLLLLSPNSPSFFQRHLNYLAKLSSLFQISFIDKLLTLTTGQQVFDEIKNSE